MTKQNENVENTNKQTQTHVAKPKTGNGKYEHSHNTHSTVNTFSMNESLSVYTLHSMRVLKVSASKYESEREREVRNSWKLFQFTL